MTSKSKFKFENGDLISFTWKNIEIQGVIIPSTTAEVLMVKLPSGYNTGFNILEIENAHVTKGEKHTLGKPPSREVKHNDNLPDVALIATGGTIATHVDYKTGGVYMTRTPEEVLAEIPEIDEIVNLSTLDSPFTIASEDMNSIHWQKIAQLAVKRLNASGARGAIVTHGTDCLGYTAAALSFMVQGHKPIAITGAQRSPDRAGFDGKMNLLCAARYVASDFGETAVVMHGSISDDYCFAMRGTKVRKMHSTRRDAFRPINSTPLAKINYSTGQIERFEHARQFKNEDVQLDDAFEPKVGFLKAVPGLTSEVIDFFVDKKYKGILIEGTALGHVPTLYNDVTSKFEKNSWIPAIKRAIEENITVAITTQAIYGSTHSYVYRNLRLLSETGAVHCKDMLSETAYVKLGWLLGHKEYDMQKVSQLMTTNLVGEINDHITSSEFLN